MSSCSLSSSSSSSTTTTEDQRDGLVPGEENAVRAWLVAQGFRSAEIRREKEFHDIGGLGVSMHPFAERRREEEFHDIGFISMHPLARGCYKGELNVCKWLYDNGAAEDITKTTNMGSTPMHWACESGHLSVCQWLFEVGALLYADDQFRSSSQYLPCS